MTIIQRSVDFDLQYAEDFKVEQSKNAYYNSLFIRSSGFTIECTNSYLSNFYKKLYNKYPKKQTYEDFFSECMYYTLKAINDFNILDDGNWIGIIDGTDKANIGRLMTYITSTVSKRIYQHVVNADKLFTRAEIDGKKGQHVMVMLNIISFDSIISDDNDTTTIENMITNDHNFLVPKNGYCWNYYLQWFNENKDRILTKNQLKYLENDVPCSKKNKRIRERVLRVWEHENPLGKKTLVQLFKERELKIWRSLFDLIYDDNVSELNKAATNWIVDNLDNEYVSNLIYDNLNGTDCKHVVNAYRNNAIVPNKVLYQIVNAVEDRIGELNSFNVKPVLFYKREDEMGAWTLEKHKEYAKYLSEFKNQKCYVFDGTGMLIRENSEESNKPLNLIVITPTGIEIQSNID